MKIQGVVSVCLFGLFIAAVVIRAAFMRRRGVNVFVFGSTDKSDYLLVPAVLIMIYTLCAGVFGFPIPGVLIKRFWQGIAAGWIGLAFCAAAVAGIIFALVGFGDSFRVGIDEIKPDKLVTDGLFAYSRNPIYLCFLLFFAGLFLVHCNIIVTVAAVLLALIIHRQILREEKFLTSRYGGEYAAYRAKVRRYL